MDITMNLHDEQEEMNKRKRISRETREAVLERDDYTCRYCGAKNTKFHIDHVYPFSRGGTDDIENLVTACYRCNLSKHDKVGIWPYPIDTDDYSYQLSSLWLGLITSIIFLVGYDIKSPWFIGMIILFIYAIGFFRGKRNKE